MCITNSLSNIPAEFPDDEPLQTPIFKETRQRIKQQQPHKNCGRFGARKSILLFLCNNSSSAFTKQNQNHKSWQPTEPQAQSKPQKSVDAKPVVTDEVQRVFKSFDANDDGKISVSELGNMLKALGSNISADELQHVMGDLYRLHSFVAASMAAALKPMLHDASSRVESEESQRWRW
ncbi:Calcium-binding EF-hand family protein [Prunus dulcis]|uniref:Calcium-binding EF-hand family protein n=1 Tax=Prunus dulcis TaxID=3755 RepID=A0A4Y1QXC9_PRUDU|nr:Calcium-binding EF-hand family protein [Prunus dulcis]